MKAIYNFPKDTSWAMAMSTIYELESEMGMTPEAVVLDDNRRVSYNRSDLKAVFDNSMTIEEYNTKNALTQGSIAP